MNKINLAVILVIVMLINALDFSCGSSQEISNNTSSLPQGNASSGLTAYTQHCVSCHGSNAVGASGPNIQGKSTATVQSTVRSGKGVMPAFSTSAVSDQSLADLVAYLQSF